MLCLGQPQALQPQVNYGNIESAGCAWWGKCESASIFSSATVGSLNKIWKNAQTSDFLNNRIFIIWNLDVNCEKLVFLVLNIAKHIFLAVLYFFGSWL